MSYSNKLLTRRHFLQGLGATWLLSVSGAGFAAVSHMIAVRIWPSSTYTRVTLESSQALKYKQFALSNPDRLVIDIENVHLNSVLQKLGNSVRAEDPFLKLARVGQFDKNTVRIVLELKQSIRPNLFELKPVAEFKNRLVIDLYPNKIVEDDPLLALLEEYNKGDLNRTLQKTQSKPATVAKSGPLIIMLDPGHGGEDPGAIGKRGTKEKVVVLQIARRLRTLLQKQKNVKVYMTRNEDVFIPLNVRVAKARKLQADLFISIHADAFSNRSARGSSVFALSRKGATSAAARFLAESQNEADAIGGVSRSGDKYLDHTLVEMVQTVTINDSLSFGADVLKRMGKINQLHKKRVEQAGFAVLKAPDIPSILVETAFISNLEEERKLKTAAFQQQIAQSIFDGIMAYSAVLRRAKG